VRGLEWDAAPGFVQESDSRLDAKLEATLNAQVNAELHSAYLYLSTNPR
jgi:hypothetical protein